MKLFLIIAYFFFYIAISSAGTAAAASFGSPDITNDGTVNLKDLSTVTTCLNANLIDRPQCMMADIDANGHVTDDDLSWVRTNLGRRDYPFHQPVSRTSVVVDPDTGAKFPANEIAVDLKPGFTATDADSLATVYGANVVSRTGDLVNGFMVRLRLPTTTYDAFRTTQAQLLKDARVESADHIPLFRSTYFGQ